MVVILERKMAISGKDFMNMSKEERDKLLPPKALCPKCKKNPILIAHYGEKIIGYPIDGVFHCPDCYYEAISDVVEKYPPCSPGMHGRSNETTN
jgi:hypothetical protein